MIYSFIFGKLKILALNRLKSLLRPSLNQFFRNIADKVVTLIGKVSWKQTPEISLYNRNKIHNMLMDDYYIIAIRRGNHFSTFFIGLANLLFTGKCGFYSSVLMNLEDKVTHISDYRLIEAVGNTGGYSTFSHVFDGADAVALLKPKCMTITEWSEVLDRVKNQVGKPYDTLFDLKDDQKLSCVELIRVSLQTVPNYNIQFANFERMITKRKNLTPQMFLDCEDFEIVFAARA